jgi:hypothetical protein
MFCGPIFSGPTKNASAKRRALICSCCAVSLCIARGGSAQTTQASGPVLHDSQAQVQSSPAHPARVDSANASEHPAGAAGNEVPRGKSPSDAAAQAAAVSLQNGKLTIESNNSDLTQILQDVAHISGMTINGLNGGPRVFGTYGPANSRDVLTALLVGSGYNFVMLGGAGDGTPRELLLTPQTRNAPATNSVNRNPVPSWGSDESEQPEPEKAPTASNPPGPGALPPAPSRNDLDDDTRVQKMLERLQHQQEQPEQGRPQNSPQ